MLKIENEKKRTRPQNSRTTMLYYSSTNYCDRTDTFRASPSLYSSLCLVCVLWFVHIIHKKQWKGLEDNPITKLLFTQCGFIPVQMAANKAGEDNEYDLASFKRLLKQAKQAFEEGFDIGILPEGQLNPHPEEALLPAFPGAFTLARMSKRPIHMMALHGTHRLWHAREDIGMTVTGRTVKARVYPGGRKYSSGDEFLATFEAVIGEFAIKGKDLDDEELTAWITGKKWKEMQESA